MKNLIIVSLFLLSISTLVRSQLISSGLTEAQKQALLDKHNQLRQQIASGSYTGQPSSSNMLFMKWDASLAAQAQSWANNMIFMHSSCTDYGENIYMSMSTGSITYNPTSPVQKWFDEVKSTLWSTSYISSYVFGNAYGHYTQVVWASTNLLGCGFVYFSEGGYKKQITVCQYREAGNWIDEPVYQVGTPCSQCGTLPCNPTYPALCGI